MSLLYFLTILGIVLIANVIYSHFKKESVMKMFIRLGWTVIVLTVLYNSGLY
jgi:hypothetical protein